MKSDFAKLLSNCQSRINEESVKVIQISNGAIVNSPSQPSGQGSSEVRPEIQGIINQKMRETQSGNVSAKDPQEKAQILFSLKDFLDNTSKETASPSPQVEEKEEDDDGGISDEDENGKNDSDEELDENDESVKDKSFKSTSSYKDDSDIEEVSIDEEEDPLSTKQKPPEEDLETEISKLDNLQRKIHDTISDPSPRPPETVLLKMGGSRPNIQLSRPQTPKASTEENVKAASKEVPGTGKSNLNETITLDDTHEEDNTAEKQNDKVNGESTPKENLTNKEKEKAKVEVTSKPSEKSKTSSLSEGMFKNISISIVGSSNKNVNIQNLFNSKSSPSTAPVPPTAANPSPSAHASSSANSASHSSKTAPASGSAGAANTFTSGPNISLKRQGSPSKPPPFDTKRFKNSSIVITSSRKDAPTITLDELVNNKEEDQEDEAPKENRAKEFNNCRCGDQLAYMCHDCAYRRWKVGYDFVKTRKPKPVVVEEKVEEAPRDVTDEKSNPGTQQSDKAAEILKNVNWSQVFSFAGIGVGQA